MIVTRNHKEALLFGGIVLGLSLFIFWGPIAFLKLRAANLVEGRIYNTPAFILFLLAGMSPCIDNGICFCNSHTKAKMKSMIFIFNLLLLVIPVSFSCRNSDIRNVERKYTDYQWLSDLDSMYGFMKKTHPGLYWKTPQKEFDNLITRIKTDIPYMTDNQIITQLCRLASLVRDGHTVFIGSNLSDKYFPVRIETFSDGFFVTAVSKKYRELYGARVMSICYPIPGFHY